MIYLVGLSHKTAPVELRERLAFPEGRQAEVLKDLQGRTGIEEAVILSTCNRTEIYAVSDAPDAPDRIAAFLSWAREISIEELGDKLYRHGEPESVLHLLRVAAGLDSLVVGESEVLGQVGAAYRTAAAAGMTRRSLHVLFQRALAAGRAAREETEIGRGSLSVGSVAVDLAEKIFGSLTGRTVLILGAGKISGLTAKHLASRGASAILVANRTFEKAQELAREHGGQAVRFDEWTTYLDKADIVISSTAAPRPIVTRETLSPALDRRGHRPIFLIDVAVPRDIDPDVERLDGVFLYNIDDLDGIVQEHAGARAQAVAKAEALVRREADRIRGWLGRSAPPGGSGLPDVGADLQVGPPSP